MARVSGQRVLALSSSLIEAFDERGRRVGAVSVLPEVFARSWQDELRPLDAPVRRVLEAAGWPASAPVTVAFTAEHCGGDITTLEGRGDAVQGRAVAAVLARTLHNGRAVRAGVVASHEEAQRTHLVVAFATESALEAIDAMARRLGLRVAGSVPRRAWLTSVGLSRAIAPSAVAGDVVCQLDSSLTVISAGTPGHLGYVRAVDLGYEALVFAWLRSWLGNAGGDASHDSASDELFALGLPDASRLDGAEGLADRHRLASMQPVLQRYAAELKQTLRFGTAEAELAARRVLVTGAGAAIPGLPRVLAEAVDLPVEPLESDGARVVARTGVLEPLSVRVRRVRAGWSRLCWAGGAAAAAALAADIALTWNRLRETREWIDGSEPTLAQIESSEGLAREAGTIVGRIEAAVGLMSERAGPDVPWAALLADVARRTTDEVRLTELQAVVDRGVPVVSIAGVTVAASGGEVDPVTRYIDALAGSAAVQRVELGATRVDRESEPPVQRFTVRVFPIFAPRLPRDLLGDPSGPRPAEPAPMAAAPTPEVP